ncbi:ornithine cyclodeaminase family protein [Inhella sp.]|uniref:ornithine cyclodeaminase family protein n=1 Tax=Inhella sp. TaxID=1921806 RepID=UPI0035B0F954
MHFIDRYALEQALSLDDALASQREAFAADARGEYEQPPRSRFDWPSLGQRTLVMPALRRGQPWLTLKIVQVSDAGAVTGQLWVLDTRSQQPLALMDAEPITLLRTAAASVLSAQLWGPPDAQTLAVLGAGAQALAHVRALAAAGLVARARIWARRAEQAEAAATQLRAELDLEVQAAPSPAAALAGAGLVCTCTPALAPLFEAGALAPEVHVMAIGAFRPEMCELPPALFVQAGVLVDRLATARSEAGDLLQAQARGLLDFDIQVHELATLLQQGPPERPARTVFKSVGLALQDHALACLALSRLGLLP